MVLSALNCEFMCFSYCFLCFCREVVEWCHMCGVR
jgi:hypothetical protein